MNKIQIKYLKTPFGELILGAFDGKLCLCDWRYRKMRFAIDDRIQSLLQTEYVIEDAVIFEEVEKQLNEYFDGNRKIFDVPLLLVGTPFQQKVWNELIKIPFGKTDTYHGLSVKLKNEKAIRAVAAANGANAISIIIPCHRIIGSDGQLVGYAGGLAVKKKLLLLEKSANVSEQLELFD